MNNRCIRLLQTIFKAKEMTKKSEVLKRESYIRKTSFQMFWFLRARITYIKLGIISLDVLENKQTNKMKKSLYVNKTSFNKLTNDLLEF